MSFGRGPRPENAVSCREEERSARLRIGVYVSVTESARRRCGTQPSAAGAPGLRRCGHQGSRLAALNEPTELAFDYVDACIFPYSHELRSRSRPENAVSCREEERSARLRIGGLCKCHRIPRIPNPRIRIPPAASRWLGIAIGSRRSGLAVFLNAAATAIGDLSPRAERKRAALSTKAPMSPCALQARRAIPSRPSGSTRAASALGNWDGEANWMRLRPAALAW